MKYTVYKIFNKTLNETYLSAGRGVLNFHNFRIQNKSILSKIKNCEINKELIEIVDNKSDIISSFNQYISNHLSDSVILFRLENKIKIYDENNKEFYAYKEELIPVNNRYFKIDIYPEKLFTKKIYVTKECRKHFIHTNLNTKRKQKISDKCKLKYPDFSKTIQSLNGKVFIKDFCEHGDIVMNWNEFNSHYKFNKGVYICGKCVNNILKSLILNETVYRKMFIELDNHDKSHSLNNEQYMLKYLPDLHKLVNEYSIADNFSEKLFMFKNGIKHSPVCHQPNCGAFTKFSQTGRAYNTYCETHKFTFNVSKLQSEIKDFVTECTKCVVIESYRKLKKEIDIFIPDLNLGIEINGLYHHSDIFKSSKYHYEKQKLFEDIGIQIIYIWEDDWHYKQEIIKSIIRNKLHATQNKIYARNCIIKNISYDESKLFLTLNHLQSSCPSSINLGLFHENILVAVMTFGKNRMIVNTKSHDSEFELLRFCNKLNLSVIGGASKLFKHFIKTYKPSKITSYANLDISNGKLYTNLNFKFDKYTGPTYWWAKKGIKYHRSKFMKFKLVADGADPLSTEDEIMKSRGYLKIWNAGNIKFIYENNT